jgi:hypothetical protein
MATTTTDKLSDDVHYYSNEVLDVWETMESGLLSK